MFRWRNDANIAKLIFVLLGLAGVSVALLLELDMIQLIHVGVVARLRKSQNHQLLVDILAHLWRFRSPDQPHRIDSVDERIHDDFQALVSDEVEEVKFSTVDDLLRRNMSKFKASNN